MSEGRERGQAGQPRPVRWVDGTAHRRSRTANRTQIGDPHDRGTHMTSNATTQTEALLLTETKDGIATLTLNRPGQFNALSSALIEELQSTFDRLALDPTVRVVVLAANGRGFCAGHDLKEIRALGNVHKVESLFARCSRMMMTITTLPQPVIARVHGIATAAGCQ